MGMRSDEGEVADLAPAEETPDLLNVLADVLVQPVPVDEVEVW